VTQKFLLKLSSGWTTEIFAINRQNFAQVGLNSSLLSENGRKHHYLSAIL